MLQPPEVNSAGITTTSALVHWNHPPDPNGIIIQYFVQYVAVSMAVGAEIRSRRQMAIIPECILGGEGNIDRVTTVEGMETSVNLTDLSMLSMTLGL